METTFKYNSLPEKEAEAKRPCMVVLTGAGISEESGVPTFRTAEGLWTTYDWQLLASVEGWKENPAAVLDFYNMRRSNLLTVQPNHAHLLLAELEKWYDVTIITQNVDNLHERAGSTDILHIHGEISKVTSSNNRNDANCIQELPLNTPLQMGNLAADGSQLRPYVVWFGEEVLDFQKALSIVRQADVFVVIGTSLTVEPAASLLHYAPPAARKFIINPGLSFDPYNERIADEYEHISMKATLGVEEMIDKLI